VKRFILALESETSRFGDPIGLASGEIPSLTQLCHNMADGIIVGDPQEGKSSHSARLEVRGIQKLGLVFFVTTQFHENYPFGG
jgi:hypothetical protein